jgi:murein peptide amidase A
VPSLADGARAAFALLLVCGISSAVPARVSSSQPRSAVIGYSVRGRPIIAVQRGDARTGRKVLVVGCIHGNECSGIAIARRLEILPAPQGVDVWIVPDLNPDGAAAGTRQNAHGVDLNRNFPWRWRRLWGVFNSGPRPLSEPESRIAYRLLLRLRPSVSIWFHQHLDLVDASGGSVAVERRFATFAGLRLRRLDHYPGSVTGWENHRFPGTTAFVVELPAGALRPRAAGRLADAVLDTVS